MRELVFLGTYFYTYEGLRVFLQSAVSKKQVIDKDHTAAWTVPLAGGISGAWAWFVSFPLDCIKVSTILFVSVLFSFLTTYKRF